MNTSGPELIVFVRDYLDRVERANNLKLSDSNREFIQEVLDICEYKGAWTWRMKDDPALPSERDELTSTVYCGQGCISSPDILLNNIRGHYHSRCIYTFAVRDCQDHRKVEDHGIFDDTEDDDGYSKDTAGTRWQNYRFWFIQDVRKAVRRPSVQPHHPMIRLDADEMIFRLRPSYFTPGSYLYFDIETRNSQCICFSVSNGMYTYSYLVYNYANVLQPKSDLVFAALAKALMRCIVVVHNALYDLPFMTFYHSFPFPPRIYCTMSSHHRLYPEADKSLAHCIALYTNYPNHKTISINETHNADQDAQLLTYNSYDVQVLHGIHHAQLLYASSSDALVRSVDQVNALVRIYGVMGLRGIKVDRGDQFLRRKFLERRLAQLTRILKIALGKYNFLPTSAQQTVNYFHTVMRYPPLELTPGGKPSLSGDLLYELASKHNNPIISLVIIYREVAKENSMLDINFPPYEGEYKL